jgi:hypothetical protein
LTTSSKIVIDHMVRTINNLMDEVSKDATDCRAADNAGVAFKAKFAALEHIAQKYESKMNDEEKAEVEQYAEDMLGSVMEKLFNVVMQVTANCGTKSFDLLGAHDVEDFYEEEARHTLAERSASSSSSSSPTSASDGGNSDVPEQEIQGPYGEVLPHGEANPDAEETVAQMKERVLELKKKLESLRPSSDSGSESGSGSASASASGGSGASESASGSGGGGTSSSGSAASASASASSSAASSASSAASKA